MLINFYHKIYSNYCITEICQRAAKAAVRDAIEAEVRQKQALQMAPNRAQQAVRADPVPDLNRKHFEEALRHARKSVTNIDLQKFEDFRKKFDPSFNKGGNQGGFSFKWPEAGGQQFGRTQQSKIQEEDDLYGN